MLYAIIINVLIGAVSGWLAGIIMNRKRKLLVNIILGILGGIVGSVILNFVGIGSTGIIGSIAVSVFGACLLIWIVKKIS